MSHKEDHVYLAIVDMTLEKISKGSCARLWTRPLNVTGAIYCLQKSICKPSPTHNQEPLVLEENKIMC